MTISSQTRTAGPFTGNGVTTVFPFAFKIFLAADLLLVRTDPATGIPTTLTLTTDYTVALNADQNANPGGNVTLTAPLGSSLTLVMTSTLPFLQATDLTNGGGFYPKVITDAFDRLTIFCQQLFGLANRSLKLPLSDVSIVTELPNAVARANNLLGFDASGNPIAVTPAAQSATALQGLLAATNGASLIGYGPSTLDVILKNSLGKVVTSITNLRAIDKTKYTEAFATGYYAQGDGGGGAYWYDSTDTTSADNGGTIIVAVDGGRWKLVLSSIITTKQFGAKGDGTTDDTVALQNAINYCLSFARASPLAVVGRCLVTASLMIDRSVDTTVSEFRIIAGSQDAGFYTTSAIKIFDSTLTVTTDPLSEFVTFENIRFECSVAATLAYCVSQKFLRMKFLNCYFYKIRLVTSTLYLQTYYLSNCNIRYYSGVFILADHAFDVSLVGCISENGGTLTNFANGFYNVRVISCLHEGSSGGIVTGGRAISLLIEGCYLEGNAQLNIALNAGPQNQSVVIKSCIFSSTSANVANASFYDIAWGNTTGAVSIGNNHINGRLHDNSNIPAGANAARMISQGDTAALSISNTPLTLDQGSGSWIPATTLGAVTVNSATYRRNGNLVHVEFSITLTSATSGSPVIITNLPYAGTASIFSGAISYSDLSGNLFLLGGSTFGGSPTQVKVSSDRIGTNITYTTAASKTFVGSLDYAI